MTEHSHSHMGVFFDSRRRGLLRLFNCFVWYRFVTIGVRFSSETLQRSYLERRNATQHNSEGFCYQY